MLIEALIGILLISVGVLGIVGLQASSIAAVTESKHRANAAFLANQILSRMWTDNPANLTSYRNNADGTGCAFSGTASTNTNVTNWLGASGSTGTVYDTLPGTSAATQQIKVGTGNTVEINLCWRSPGAAAFHSYTLGTQINGTAP
ncbi:MAG: hypothetical protein COZ09_00310 [Comamonadaceae bacterium CG_4_10_14_3_um_filter_60_42]|nr:MAG: hypothetical protein AUK51_14705 [Comamonadaceae bacterium CG2_30_59_20]PIY30316.1 MAG: hypothetical protein COZ09_00310 [Comamonadaceae bacterium CG_4_10_14_3_um_filter_60_42]